MATYVIGDIQGCYDPLLRLLDKINFDQSRDFLWFCGDLINRGPSSLQTLEFIKNLDEKYHAADTVLGNHDLHLISCFFNKSNIKSEDNFTDILEHANSSELILYLLSKKLFHYDSKKNYCIAHAGVHPAWDLELTVKLHQDYHEHINSLIHAKDKVSDFFKHMYGNLPNGWSEQLAVIDKYRFIINVFTRMRFVDKNNNLLLDFKGEINDAPVGYIPWFNVQDHKLLNTDSKLKILIGHWASLHGHTNHPKVIGLDTACVYGGDLTAYCVEKDTKYCVRC